MRLTGRFFAIYGFLQLLGVMSFIMPTALFAYAGLTAILLVAALMDRESLVAASSFRLSLQLPTSLRLGQDAIAKLRVEALDPRVLRLSEVRVLAPPLSLLRFSDRQMSWRPHTGQSEFEAAFGFQVARLGFIKIGKWPLAATSRFGLMSRAFELELEPIELRVHPERNRLPEQAFQEMIHASRILAQGARLMTRGQAAEQFHSIRPYQFPDPLRFIDQKKMARYGKPMTRVYEALHNHHLIIALDTGRAMAGEIRGSAKSDYYLSAALALAENAVRSRDRVSLVSFSQKVHVSIKGAKTLSAFSPLFRSGPEFLPRDEETNYRLIPDFVSRMTGTRALVVILTDSAKPSVRDGLLEALAPVCRQHLTVVLSLKDRDNDLESRVMAFAPSRVAESNADSAFNERYADLIYSYWSQEMTTLFRNRLARMGGGSLNVSDADWMSCVERLYSLLRNSQFA